MFKVPERCRLTTGSLRSDKSDGNNGVFIIYYRKRSRKPLKITTIVSDSGDWEHVSVVVDLKKNRPPHWDEMNFIKGVFWDEDDVVVQFHPKKKDYINNHKNCLHLFRLKDKEFPTPPKEMVGI